MWILIISQCANVEFSVVRFIMHPSFAKRLQLEQEHIDKQIKLEHTEFIKEQRERYEKAQLAGGEKELKKEDGKIPGPIFVRC